MTAAKAHFTSDRINANRSRSADQIILSAVLLCALAAPAFADGTGKSSNATAPSANANSAPKPDREKKIYTNEDVDALARNYGASTVGNAARDSSLASTSQRQGSRQIAVAQFARTPQLPLERDPVWYAQQYASLSARIADIDSQVQRLRNFRVADAPPGQVPGFTFGLNIYGPCPAITTDAEIEKLLRSSAPSSTRKFPISKIARESMAFHPERSHRTPEIAQSAENISPLTPEDQAKIVRQQLEQLQAELAKVRELKSQMQQEAAAQHMTLIPETKYGGGFTADYLKQLEVQQNTIAQQLNEVEDQALRVGIPPRALP